MSVVDEHRPAARPRSPWTGSLHQTQHCWELDQIGSLSEAGRRLRDLGEELTAAHTAGWELVEPMRRGCLHAARASRRRRDHRASVPARSPGVDPADPPLRHRVRLVDEPAAPEQRLLNLQDASGTPVLTSSRGGLVQVRGPQISVEVRSVVEEQVAPAELRGRLWGLAAAPVGWRVDLVADGSALRHHSVQDQRLVLTEEALVFAHASDGSGTLLQAAAAYQRLAARVEAAAAVGGRLLGVDDGLLHIAYGQAGR